MAKVKGLEQAMSEFNRRIQKALKDGSIEVVVGFSAPYAWKVHEDEEAVHANGQAKFLEQPAVENGPSYGAIVAEAVAAGKSPQQAATEAAEQLKRDAQELCPVRLGQLRDSAYVRVQKRSGRGRGSQWR